MSETQRNSGLDIARSIAIILVLYSHFFIFFNELHSFSQSVFTPFVRGLITIFRAPAGIIGYWGVDLFFVLSGFLIGKILIKNFIIQDKISDKNVLIKFYFRRWFRTLPLYYLMLIIYIIIYYLMHNEFIFPIENLFFLQLFFENIKIMGISWSLCIEEWFYLLFPIFILCLKRFVKNFRHQHFLIFLGSLIILITVIRIILVGTYDLMFEDCMYNLFLRFDFLSIGIIFAYLEIFNKNLFKFFAKKRFFITSVLVLFGILIFFCYQILLQNETASYYSYLNQSFFAKTIMFNIVSTAFGFIICFLYNLKIKGISFFTHTSKISYSLYLAHIPVIIGFLALLETGFLNGQSIIFYIILLIVLCYIVSTLLYKYYEQPLRNLRDNNQIKQLYNTVKINNRHLSSDSNQDLLSNQ